MSSILALLTLLVLVLGALFLIWPAGFYKLTKQKWSRGRIFLASAVTFFVLAILTGATTPPMEVAPEDVVDEDAIREATNEVEIDPEIESAEPTEPTPSVETIELKYIQEPNELQEQPAESSSTTSAATPAPQVTSAPAVDETTSTIVTEPEPAPASEPEPEPVTTTPVTTSSSCNCSGPDLDCGNFATHASAQALYECCMEQTGRDVYDLDGNDDDGLACESRP